MIINLPSKVLNGEAASLVVECDQCGAHSKKPGRDHGEASEKARSEGFITINGAMLSSPKSWLCLACQGYQKHDSN